MSKQQKKVEFSTLKDGDKFQIEGYPDILYVKIPLKFLTKNIKANCYGQRLYEDRVIGDFEGLINDKEMVIKLRKNAKENITPTWY